MDEALIEDAEHHERCKHRGQHQHALPLQRILEHLRGALEPGHDRGRQVGLPLDLPDVVHRGAEGITGSQIERNRHRGLLALVIDLQRADRRHQLGYGGARDYRSGWRARAIDARPGRRRDGAAAGRLTIEIGL